MRRIQGLKEDRHTVLPGLNPVTLPDLAVGHVTLLLLVVFAHWLVNM
jgi:hypothetical protein